MTHSIRKISTSIKDESFNLVTEIFVEKFLEEIFCRNLNLIQIILPLDIIGSKSIFHYIVDLLASVPLYFEASTDSLEHMKSVITVVLSGLSQTMYWNKFPFTPFIGETA